MAAFAVLLDNFVGSLLGADRVRNRSEKEGGYVMVAGFRLDPIFWDESMGCVAVIAGSPILMSTVKPALIDVVHHVAVIAGGGVVAQVRGEVGDVKSRSDDSEDGERGDDESYFCHTDNVKSRFFGSIN